MKTGRELDALVAEKVMGESSGYTHSRDNDFVVTCSRYSTDISAAWLVVEKLRDIGWSVAVCGDNGWGCTFYKVHTNGSEYIWATWKESHGPINADTAPLAICLAALEAVGVDIESPK